MGISIMVILKWFAMTLGWLSHDNQYQLFLAPKFGFLIYISMAFFLIFALGMARVKVRTGIDHCIKGMILLLPVLFIFSVGENTLGNFALSKRTGARTNSGALLQIWARNAIGFHDQRRRVRHNEMAMVFRHGSTRMNTDGRAVTATAFGARDGVIESHRPQEVVGGLRRCRSILFAVAVSVFIRVHPC